MEKWKNKFQNSVKHRVKQKKLCDTEFADPEHNHNFTEIQSHWLLKDGWRVKSRMSNDAPTQIDVNLHGNSLHVDHLLRYRKGATGNCS
jgi:hypothetical protein